jgi:hypothetical protein
MKKMQSLKNSKLVIIKLNTSSIQYFLGCQWLLSYQQIPQSFMEIIVQYTVHKNVIQRSPKA